jgi:hypothetical protein
MAAVGTNPYINQEMAKEIEAILRPRLRDGENCVSALERLLREKDVETYDRSVVDHAREEARSYRRLFFAACMSQPDHRLRISELAEAALGGPDMRSEFSIVEAERPAHRDREYRVFRKRAPDSTRFTAWDLE